MKKLLPLLILFLTCCGPAPTPADPSLTAHSRPTADWSSYQPAIEAFRVGAECLHLCWLGINPRVTTAAEAYKLLKASDQIDQKTLQATETGIVAKWFTEKTKKLDSSVYVYLEKDLVKSISFDRFAPFKIKDFMDLLGDPFAVNIDMEVTGNVMYMPYEAYYSSQLVLVGSEAADAGPNSNDGLVSLSLNIKYDDKIFRPWVGYGHLKEYFAGKQVHQHPANP